MRRALYCMNRNEFFIKQASAYPLNFRCDDPTE